MDEIVSDFLVESRENLDRLDQELVSLESDPGSKELLGSIFRTIHTIKGSCGFLGFAKLEKVAHAGENLLSKLRDGVLVLNAEITSALLAMVDAVRRMLNEIQTTEADGDNDYPELLERLKRLQADRSSSSAAVPQAQTPQGGSEQAGAGRETVEAVRILPAAEIQEKTSQREAAAPGVTSGSDISASQSVPAMPKIGAILVERGSIVPHDLDLALRKQQEGDHRKIGEILVDLGCCTPDDVTAAQQLLEARGKAAAVETVRVDVGLLDMLMNLVGELVLARNQLLQISNACEDAALQSIAQRLSLIVTEVQEQVIKTRMQPIGNVWNKFPRTVRDLALNCGKEVRLEMEGQDTELDRTIIEAIRDPLTHLVRNAIDHGIELPEIRREAGKEPTGHVRLRACQEGGKVTVEVSDDGAGLNVERLCNKAVERGLITPQQARRMSEREAFNLIFLPGFSTAEKVTNVSGRGVGMDVVRINVEKISGTIDVDSTPGKGTSVRIKIPLTLAIVPALIVSCRNERFTIPQVSVLELVGLDGSGTGPQIETVHGHPVYRLRGNLLPLVYLDRELKLEAAEDPRPAASSIVVLQADTRQFGLVVDDILDTEEIVVKPLGEHVKGLNAYAGATIMGDGRVSLILDVVGLAQRACVIGETHSSAAGAYGTDARPADSGRAQTFLLARNGPELQVAIPLSDLARLEGLPANLLRRIGSREVMEYRGQVIPMLRLSQLLPRVEVEQEEPACSSIEVVIYSENGHTAGLIVDCIVDMIEENPVIEALASRPGVIGSFILDHQVIELLDLPAIVRNAIPDFGLRVPPASASM